MKCIHHNDLDGKCSAAIVKSKYSECELIEMNYGREFNIETIEPGELIFMVDFSLPMEIMRDISARTRNFIWIDHHVTAIDAYEENINIFQIAVDGLEIQGKREIGKAGCELTWEYLYPEKEIPLVVKLLADYDVWRNNLEDWETDVLPLQYSLINIKAEQNWRWEKLIASVDAVYSEIKNGRLILTYQDELNADFCKQYAFETFIDNFNVPVDDQGNPPRYKAICLNTPQKGSRIFKSIWNSEKYDVMCKFNYAGNKWEYSLYTEKDNIDVSEIAKKYGGGGHKGAAGFITEKLILKGV